MMLRHSSSTTQFLFRKLLSSSRNSKRQLQNSSCLKRNYTQSLMIRSTPLPLDDQYHNKLSFRHLQSTSHQRFVKQSTTLDMPVVNAPQATLELLDLDNFDSETAETLFGSSPCLFLNEFYEPAFPVCSLKNRSILPLTDGEKEIVCEINFALWDSHTDKMLSMQASYGQQKKAQSIRVVIHRKNYMEWIKKALPILEERRQVIEKQAAGVESQNINSIIETMKWQLNEYEQCLHSEAEASSASSHEQTGKEPKEVQYEVIFFTIKDDAILKKFIKQIWKQQKEPIDTKDFTSHDLSLRINNHNIVINSSRQDIWEKINDVFIIEEFDGQGHISKYFERHNHITKAEIEHIRSTVHTIMQAYNSKLLRENSCLDLLDLFHGVLYCQSGADRKIRVNTPEEISSARRFYWWAQKIATLNIKPLP
ncbi:hypothetical protein C9374_010355 [Naegleria lovaniensis]|uniref:Uncharacterized protein n=1 Tax=Naegleria lovaniensis TaxID=51637 RepID=A0AA88GEC4_NAELO|nr:uncharacterized protein C9374_010355 [Naegleria lovaniensis]KAG2374981.1 hypothetical protein C9374_010355 [Naegleria lovaniensis]